jgi:hypothetical protein
MSRNVYFQLRQWARQKNTFSFRGKFRIFCVRQSQQFSQIQPDGPMV